MSSVTPVFVFHSLNVGRGGLTKAVMTRANTLANHFDNVQFFTFFYQQEHKEIIQKLYDSGKLDRRVKVYNLFIDVNPFETEFDLTQENVEETELIRVEDTASVTPSYSYYKNGLCVKCESFVDEKLAFVDYFDEFGLRTHREEYNGQGKPVRIRHMDRQTNKPRLDRYVDNAGKCYLTVEIDPETGKEGQCGLFYPESMTFKNPDELCVYWISKKIAGLESPVMMADSRHSYNMLLKIRSNKAKRVVILHNNHYKFGELRPVLRPLFKSINKYDGVVLLTNEQKEDVSREFGKLDNCFVIPHGADKPSKPESEGDVEYDPYLAVTLARLEPQKRLEEAIRAFRYVVKKIPKARYEIYGTGSEKGKLQNLIKKFGLQDNVKLKGYTNQPALEYKKAACSILTSAYEGSPLVLYETLAVGTPAVSYKTKYGPSDLIRDGLDGFLVGSGKPKRLAAKIVSIMKKPQLRRKMSEHTTEVTERFSFKKYEENWVNLMNALGLESDARFFETKVAGRKKGKNHQSMRMDERSQ